MTTAMTRGLMLGLAIALSACGGERNQSEPKPAEPEPLGTPLEAEPQRPGDPDAGYRALVEEGYVGCGIPYDVYRSVFAAAPPSMRLPDRGEKNEEVAYVFNVVTTERGVDVMMPNCLACHAQPFDGQIVVGLGDTLRDYTTDTAGLVQYAAALTSDPDELAEIEKFAERTQALSAHVKTATVGVNPAENITAVLIAHRDQETLAWSNEPLLPLPPPIVVPVDVPPWWRMQKKHAMFYTGSGRGDHARIMMTASTLCVDTVAQAEQIDSYFDDVRAYISSIEPPAYPQPVDQALADQGQTVFEATCAQCHGSYGADETYPNLLIASEDVGTDPVLATASAEFADVYADWYNGSFYGELSRIESGHGYVAPPLDGIWITAPYLHNGSVPTIEALLDSKKRPKYWTRSYQSADYDYARLGWAHAESPHGHAGEADPDKRKLIYDTTLLGYGNGGHTYGDALSDADRAAVIEYLKTL